MMNFILSSDAWLGNMVPVARSPFLLDVFAAITFFGDKTTIIGIAVIVAAYLAFSNYQTYKSYIISLATTLLGAIASIYALKELIARVRPGDLGALGIETSYSFPSGHATLAMALYGFLAIVLSKHYPRYTNYIATGAAIIILSIGFSRLYLGVHFPTDILGGYLLGALWLLIGIRVANRYK